METILSPDFASIRMEDYAYELPADRIANFPLEERDAARLLVWQQGQISHRVFRQLPELLTGQETMFFNNTKVLPARLYFRRETGAVIEVFLLHPLSPSLIISETMIAGAPVVWQCAIGNLKRWKDQEQLVTEMHINGQPLLFSAELADREKQQVRFSWNRPELRFVDLVMQAGETPLPPYIRREATEQDRHTYQTVYGKKEGAVAAPTAGLHFTDRVLANLDAKGVNRQELTLHVSAGTFKPIKVSHIPDHDMHEEQMIVSQANLRALLEAKKVVAVGTTSMRTVESLYWFGVRLLAGAPPEEFIVGKLEPYRYTNAQLPTRKQAFEAVLGFMQRLGKEEMVGETSIFIFPGYTFRVCDALVTNFHMPSTTLILLIAAFIGEDWRSVYQTALAEGYRFLSYGDSSLLFNPSAIS